MLTRPRWIVLVAAVLALALTPLRSVVAEHASEFTARDKSEIFIQHVVKFLNLAPEKYQALVLEFEIATALAEVGASEVQDVAGSFIANALSQLYPDFGAARELKSAVGIAVHDALVAEKIEIPG